MSTVGVGGVLRSRGALSLCSEEGPDRNLIRLAGELDLAAAGLPAEEVARFGGDDARMIVIDLSELEFIDAAGIHMLLDLEAASRKNGGRLRMIRASGSVQRVLELTGADEQLSYLS
jgi:anti-anti-sigma factor